ncbi:hypothetical protein DF186_25105, partial [Enterococcus hirae]
DDNTGAALDLLRKPLVVGNRHLGFLVAEQPEARGRVAAVDREQHVRRPRPRSRVGASVRAA